jgi:hypothetical protein
VVALVAIVAVGLVVGLNGGNDPKKTAEPVKAPANAGAELAGNAAQHLAGVPGLRYNGSFSSSGSTVQAQLAVTTAGSASGSVTVGGTKADLVTVDGSTFLKADTNFWRSHGGVTANPEDYAGKWTRAPASALDLNIKALLAPTAVAQRLRTATATAGAEDVNGSPATKVTTSDGDVYISTAQPNKVLRLQNSGAETYKFDATELSAADMNSLFTELRGKVGQLAGALDPGVRLMPVGGLKFSGCGAESCTMKYSVTSPSGDSATQVQAVMQATIRADGRDLGSCTDKRPLGSGTQLDLGCTVTSGAWKSWASKARSTPGSHRYEGEAHVVAEVISAADVRTLLSKVDGERQGA